MALVSDWLKQDMVGIISMFSVPGQGCVRFWAPQHKKG